MQSSELEPVLLVAHATLHVVILRKINYFQEKVKWAFKNITQKCSSGLMVLSSLSPSIHPSKSMKRLENSWMVFHKIMYDIFRTYCQAITIFIQIGQLL
jgi:hypothetical protein